MADTDPASTADPAPESAPPDIDPRPVRASLIELDLDHGSGLVTATLTPSPDASAISVESLQEMLAEAGYGDFYAPDMTLQSVVLQANRANTGSMVVAERRDSVLSWRMPPDRSALYLTATRCYGGKGLTRERLVAELAAQRVPRECLCRQELEQLVAQGHGENVCVARARPPENGEDARFEVLVEACKNLELLEDERGRVDLHQLHEFVVVEAGTELMRRIPPTAGVPGMDVVGTSIPAKPGTLWEFSRDTEGAAVSPVDPHLLVATAKGHPVVVPRGVRVDPMLRIQNVNLDTGNIDFDGSLEIAGDVTSGFVVQASGDIYIRGMVEKARVVARKNLVIQGGILGEEKVTDDGHQLRTHVQAGGDISARFVNLAEVTAGRDLMVREYVLQSQLRSGGKVLLGQGGGKGSIIGGQVQAALRVVANTIGSEACVPTEVRVGRPNRKRRLTERLNKALNLCRYNCQKLETLLQPVPEDDGKLHPPMPERAGRIQATLSALRIREQRLLSILERLAARQRQSKAAAVEIKRALHPNVTVTIDGVTHTWESEFGPRVLVRSGAELVSAPD